MGEVVERVEAALDAIACSDRPEVWITVVDADLLLAAARRVERRTAAGERLPLAGVTVGVKDNIDVAGVPTTAGCPAYRRVAAEDAPCVAALVDAGALVVGKTNMDQFATGLVGTRTPYGAVRNAVDAGYVAGGSSSGSAVAVALGQVDLALGTDTAGSGRVPAAFNGIVGLKPTRGVVSTRGTVPACVSLDCVSIFTRSAAAARRAFDVMALPDPFDPYSRPMRLRRPLRRTVQVVGVPDVDDLDVPAECAKLFQLAAGRLDALGVRTEAIDLAPFLQAGRVLYDGALVAERYAAVGRFVAGHRDEVDPVVAGIIERSAALPAYQLAADLDRLARLRLAAAAAFRRVDALMLPTAPFHPTIEEVAAAPVTLNEQLGVFSHFCNPLDLCAMALPSGQSAIGLPWGVTVFAPAFDDVALADFGGRYLGEPVRRPGGRAAPSSGASQGRLLVVAGAHLRGQPRNRELTVHGGRFVERTTTAASYRFYRLATDPPKPGLVRVSDPGGASIEVEVWELDDRGFARLVSATLPPLAIGSVQLADGRWLPGFVCQAGGTDRAEDITAHGGWRAYLQAGA